MSAKKRNQNLSRVAGFVGCSLIVSSAIANPSGLWDDRYTFVYLAGIALLASIEGTVIIIEALFYRWLLRLRFRRALAVSAVANTLSFVGGFPVGWFLAKYDSTMYWKIAISVGALIEVVVVVSFASMWDDARGPKRPLKLWRAARVCLLLNLVSMLIVMAVVEF